MSYQIIATVVGLGLGAMLAIWYSYRASPNSHVTYVPESHGESKGSSPAGSDSIEKCTICHESLSRDCVVTKCIHKFHRICLNTWRGYSQVCPICRTAL